MTTTLGLYAKAALKYALFLIGVVAVVEQRAAADAEVVDFPLVAQHLAQLIRIGLSSAGADARRDAVADAGHADGVLVIVDADGRVGISRGGGLRQDQQEQHDDGRFEAGELHGGFRL